jgi:alpha-beta hydrolase superfamily lysophospholipase
MGRATASLGSEITLCAADKFIELFYRANDNQFLQRIEIPYEAGYLHGLRLGAATASRGTILIHAGFDAYVEEFYALAQAIALCGYEVVMFDGPGQGSTLMREKIPMTHEWEKPVGAVLDHLALTDVTLIGISLGGYLAVRTAAFEPRIKRWLHLTSRLISFSASHPGAAR